MAITRNREETIRNFEELPHLFDYPSDTETDTPNMTTIVSDNTNPFADDVVIGEKVGNSLFNKATAGLDDDEKLDFNIENAQVFKAEMDNANATYVWGPVTFQIEDSSGNKKDLMEDFEKLTEDEVLTHSKTIWNAGADMKIPTADEHLTKEAVQLRIRSVMMSKFIRNSLKKSARRILDLNKKKFQFKHVADGRIEEDGPMMLKLIYDRINPSTRVGVRNLTNKLDQMNLEDYNQSVPEMIDAYENTYNLIIEKEGTYSNQVSSLFDALLTSTNKDFSDSINDHLDKWEDGEKYSLESLKIVANKKYNNLCERYKRKGSTFKENCTSSSHVNVSPTKKDAQIMALATEIESLKSKLYSTQDQSFYGNRNGSGSENQGRGNQGANNSSGNSPIATWRKTKNLGPKVFKDGKWYYWCEHHKVEGDYDGLYVTHPPEKHAEWLERKNRNRRGQRERDPSSNKLVLSDNLKSALLTQGFTPLQLSQIEDVSESQEN